VLFRCLLVPAVLLLVLGHAPAAAQGQFSLAVLKRSDLSFGTVIAGLPRNIAVNSPQAGKYEIQGQPRGRVQLTINVPVNVSSGTATVPIEFAASDAAWNSQDQLAGIQLFDPRQGADIRLSPSGRAWIWLGGRLVPDARAAAGQYTAIITLSAALN
jgi:hypothetical protein